MELADYNMTFIHIKGSNKIIADAISRLKMLDIYKDPVEDPKKPQIKIQVTEVNDSKIHTLDSDVFYTE